MGNILEVKDLCKTYIINKRQNNVLRNVNFQVEEGEMVAVMGPSGSGKSTLLYAVSGMDGITAGNVKFAGKEIHSLPQKKLAQLRLDEMGFVFQKMYMLKNLSVLDNIILPARQSKKNHSSRREQVLRGQELMRKLGIVNIAENDINEVSGGQLQPTSSIRDNAQGNFLWRTNGMILSAYYGRTAKIHWNAVLM